VELHAVKAAKALFYEGATATGIFKILVNLFASRDLLALTWFEKRGVASGVGRGRHFVTSLPTSSFMLVLRAVPRINNIVNFWNMRPRTAGIETHQTYRFVQELLVENRHWKDTTHYEDVIRKGRVWRIPVESGRRLVVASNSDFERYYRKVMALADSIRSKGILDSEWDGSQEARQPSIGAALDQDGRLLHFRCGHHRLALAHVLGIERIPVKVICFSGQYLNNFLGGRRVLLPRHFLSAARAGIEQASQVSWRASE